jgi:hypothetical protein
MSKLRGIELHRHIIDLSFFFFSIVAAIDLAEKLNLLIF